MDGGRQPGHVAPGSRIQICTDNASAKLRIDVFLASYFPGYSRSFFKKLISDGLVFVNNVVVKSSHELKPTENITVNFPLPPQPPTAIPFDPSIGVEIVHKHDDFLIVYKPAGLLVHRPHDYSTAFTLVDWLTASYRELATVGIENRPAIVHRLDKDTSGLLIVPRNSYAYAAFGKMFRNRTINKEYLAIVEGIPERTGTVELSIGRDPVHKHKMIHCPRTNRARDAVTHYRLLASNTQQSLVEVHPVTGRTHQIRVHLAAIGHPLIGDPVYGKPSKIIKRQALHARRLSFEYEGQQYNFVREPPIDMQTIINFLPKI